MRNSNWIFNINSAPKLVSKAKFLARLFGLVLCGFALNVTANEIAIPSPAGTMRAFWFEAPSEPQGNTPAPVVISLHGCGGQYLSNGSLSAAAKEDQKRFNAVGVHVLALDSFAHHGVQSICATPDVNRTVNEQTRRADLQAAYLWLATKANVDIKRVVLIGRSHGAQTILHAIENQFIQTSPIRPIAAIALYPGCTKFLKQFRYQIGVPLTLLVGELDNWTPPLPCAQLAQSAGSGTAKINFEQYADSYHGFDGTSAVQMRSNVGNTRSGTATVGGNPHARAASNEKIMLLVSQIAQKPL